MKNKLRKLAVTLYPTRLSGLASYLLRDEASSGRLIVGAAAIGLLAANTGLNATYQSIWQTQFGVGLGQWSMSLSLHDWIGEGLMAFFFLVVGLELKRELIRGELRDKRTALLPIGAAIGGMLVPALLYLAVTMGHGTESGWAIPTATDIALAIGLLALLGRRIPSSIRIFILALAIVDDILAVVIIAVFYNSSFSGSALGMGAVVAGFLWILAKTKYLNLPIFILGGVALWLTFYASGIHPSIAGAILGMLAPVTIRHKERTPLSERIEKAVVPFSTFFVVPIFALANTGITLSLKNLSTEANLSIAGGIVLGLVVGKVTGIVGVSYLMIKLGFAKLPARANWGHLVGIGLLAGIGFTVSIFVTDLAFSNEQLVNTAKFSILIASIISACLGLFVLRFTKATD